MTRIPILWTGLQYAEVEFILSHGMFQLVQVTWLRFELGLRVQWSELKLTNPASVSRVCMN
jgi:hypothetical protein